MSTIKYAKVLKEKHQNVDYHFKILGTLLTHDNNETSEVIKKIILQYTNDLLPFSNSIFGKNEIRTMDSLSEVNNFEDYERLLIELNSNLSLNKNPNKDYTFNLNERTYKTLKKMSKHNGYDDISEFLDIWIQGFNIEKF